MTRPRPALLCALTPLLLAACGGVTPAAPAAMADVETQAARACPAPCAPLTLAADTLSVAHLHRATLGATFRGLRGDVALRLDGPQGSGLVLETRAMTLDGSAASRTLVFAAPGLPTPGPDAALDGLYRVVVSQGGRDVASAPVTLTETLLKVTATVLPAEVAVHPGQAARFTVEVRVSPPLDAPLPLTLGLPVEGAAFAATPVSGTTGDGATLRRDFTVTFPADFGAPSGTSSALNYAVNVGDVTFYRNFWYGTRAARLAWRAE